MKKYLDFDEIRPFYDEELPEIIPSVIAEPGFKHAIEYIMPGVDYKQFCDTMLSCTSKKDFQSKLAVPFLYRLVKASTTGVDASGFEYLDHSESYTFMSNHRDIVLDASFLNIMLIEHGFETSEVAIGDNLLIYPWISNLVRINKSVIVNRDVPVRKMLEVSRRLSNYINFAIKIKHQSLWIAQREGRAKDSDDRTQESVIKMLNLGGGSSDVKTNIMGVNIVPVSISYEYDPCDFLKAREFQLKRDCPDYKKTPHDDLLNMETGILGQKGHIHFAMSEPLNKRLAEITENLDKTEMIARITHLIDHAIHSNYMIYPINYIAYDMLYDEERFAKNYMPEEKNNFINYIQGQIDKITDIPDKDENFLRKKMLEMYSNPLKNKLSASNSL
ncbi:acyltransferase [Coprobacter tertius]|uniref:Acyltransferase n=1 Tax=Coprobacter tertius TaxID=2944915 RepID=A0ABT1MIZ7_9BACT|nr:acyltransferase [Coprobacter tertius]MCP9612598.1 acyltransferase [Coprobacter tertius]